MTNKLLKSDKEWANELHTDLYQVERKKGTEPPFAGKYEKKKTASTYRCACCGAELFSSDAKYDSGSGWPSFYKPANNAALEEHSDMSHGMTRTEVTCAKCDAHLGHVFPDGPRPTGLRYC